MVYNGGAGLACGSLRREFSCQDEGQANGISARSTVDLAEDDVDGAQDRGHVRELVAHGQVIHRLKMREARRAELRAVGPVRAVGPEVDAELALGRLHGAA